MIVTTQFNTSPVAPSTTNDLRTLTVWAAKPDQYGRLVLYFQDQLHNDDCPTEHCETKFHLDQDRGIVPDLPDDGGFVSLVANKLIETATYYSRDPYNVYTGVQVSTAFDKKAAGIDDTPTDLFPASKLVMHPRHRADWRLYCRLMIQAAYGRHADVQIIEVDEGEISETERRNLMAAGLLED